MKNVAYFLSILSLSCFGKVEWSNCKNDLEKFCPKFAAGSPKATQCLTQKVTSHGIDGGGNWRGELSMNCNDTVRHAQFHEICKADIAKFCGGIEAGSHRIHKCIKEKSSKVEPDCGAFLRDYLGLEYQGVGPADC